MKDREWSVGAASRYRPDGRVGTPFFPRVAALCARNWYFNWDVRHVVDEFEDFITELAAIRNGVALGDMSPLAKTEVSGPDAVRLVQRLIVRDITELRSGQIYFTPWCTDDGKVITDGLCFRTGEDSFRFTSDPTVQWFRNNAEGLDVTINDVTDDYGILTVQGPRSRELLEAVTGSDWSTLDFSRVDRAMVGEAEVEVARTGFTGELGYEIMVPAASAAQVWDRFYDSGQAFGVVPAGEYALDIARVEAGLLITGCDYTHAGPDPSGSHTPASADPSCLSSPWELNLGHFVDLSKDDFIGKAALQAEHEAGPARRLVGLELDWRALTEAHVARGIAPTLSPRVNWRPLPLFAAGAPAGWASSTTWSPTTKKLIAFGHVDRAGAESGATVEVEWKMHGGDPVRTAARIVQLPFISMKRNA